METANVEGGLAERAGPRWFLDAVRSGQPVAEGDVVSHFNPAFVEAVGGAEQPVAWVTRMATNLQVVDPVTDNGDHLRVVLRPVGSVPRFRVLLTVDDQGRIAGFDFGPLEVEGIEFESRPTSELDDPLRAELHRLFDLTYRDADHEYLDESAASLDRVVFGRAGQTVAGFALGAWRNVDIPRRPAQDVKLAGLVCIDPEYRRRGLASRLGELAIAGGTMPAEHVLFGGRMAHPASYRQASARVGSVPRPDRRPNRWQRECGVIVAGLLGVSEFDPETFVCRGRSRPIGTPIVEVDVTPEEWKVFAPVNRDRGETLLCIWWGGDPGPDGWIDEER